ncbi:MAG TPA: hypothetical protein VFE47_21300 [Tepidisphaeraceae bacterium]|jgi:hypothetical protein|nr:hypothetical protein [Tepidisphaeraceae bacterium]
MQQTNRSTHWKADIRNILLAASVAAMALGCGCKRSPDSSDKSIPGTTTGPTTAAAGSASGMVAYQDKGAHFDYPDTWKPEQDKEYELHLIPASGPANRDITFDIPDLPPHFPGMIRLSLIENGYVKDLKKNHADLHVDNSADHDVPGGGKARLVESSWKENGSPRSDVGFLIMRKEQVYIFSCDASAKDLPATRADFDKIIASLRWDK